MERPLGVEPVVTVVMPVVGGKNNQGVLALTGLVEEHVPAPRLTEGLAVVHSGMAFGVALGAAVVGYVVDHAGASASYGVVITAGAIGAILAWTLPDRSAPDRRTPPLAEVPA